MAADEVNGPDITGVGAHREPAEILAASASALLAVAAVVLGPWVQRSVERRWRDYTGEDPDQVLRTAAVDAGAAATVEIMGLLGELLGLDADAQRTGPLAVLRRAVAYPTMVLRAVGVPAVVRDDFAARNCPHDDYDLSPANFADIDEALHEPGLIWGAAKAHVALTRRRGVR